AHGPRAIEALNSALEGIPPERVRFHVCWGNYGAPHHKDVPLEEIIDHVLKVNAGTIYVEGGTPRHAHEWRVFQDHPLPDDKKVILGVIDTKSNFVEHPRLIADRLVPPGNNRGQGRVLARPHSGFSPLLPVSPVAPSVAPPYL